MPSLSQMYIDLCNDPSSYGDTDVIRKVLLDLIRYLQEKELQEEKRLFGD